MCKYANMQMCKCENVKMCKYANVQICKCENVQMGKWTNGQMGKWANVGGRAFPVPNKLGTGRYACLQPSLPRKAGAVRMLTAKRYAWGGI
jgi:hypothetical protein